MKTNGDQGQRENVNSCQNNNNKMLLTEGQGLRTTAIFSSECAERKKTTVNSIYSENKQSSEFEK